ncbi:Rapid ALkalinization Factor [Parasponia andersonii]|uniref:Rapid ALkalinization Factor n=1 Tax=Parasponia andersonii TaxID=3476 RepID=A0A2P5D7Y0_PARAD|nr:Rapid ALkalinization Factor [Parasponia andersonii]
MGRLQNAQMERTNIFVTTILLLVVINLIGNSNANRKNIDYGVIEGDKAHGCGGKHSRSCLGKPKNAYQRGCMPEERCRGRGRPRNGDEEEEIYVCVRGKNSTKPPQSHKDHHDHDQETHDGADDGYNRKVLNISTPDQSQGDGADDHGCYKIKAFKPTHRPKQHRKH